jgi:hypothetical protein
MFDMVVDQQNQPFDKQKSIFIISEKPILPNIIA